MSVKLTEADLKEVVKALNDNPYDVTVLEVQLVNSRKLTLNWERTSAFIKFTVSDYLSHIPRSLFTQILRACMAKIYGDDDMADCIGTILDSHRWSLAEGIADAWNGGVPAELDGWIQIPVKEVTIPVTVSERWKIMLV